MGMVTMYRCGLVGVVVRRYMYIDILTIINNFPYSICISSFLAAASLLCSFFSFLFIRIRIRWRNVDF